MKEEKKYPSLNQQKWLRLKYMAMQNLKELPQAKSREISEKETFEQQQQQQ